MLHLPLDLCGPEPAKAFSHRGLTHVLNVKLVFKCFVGRELIMHSSSYRVMG